MMKYLLIAAALLFGLLGGCAGAHSVIRAESSLYDVSMSGSIRDSSGKLLPPDQLEVVGAFKQRAYGWGILWSMVPLNSIDLSQAINDQVQKVHGKAITNFTVRVNNGFINYIWGANLLPVWPGYIIVDFQGDIVRAKQND